MRKKSAADSQATLKSLKVIEPVKPKHLRTKSSSSRTKSVSKDLFNLCNQNNTLEMANDIDEQSKGNKRSSLLIHAPRNLKISQKPKINNNV
jgi:hypothetical protein